MVGPGLSFVLPRDLPYLSGALTDCFLPLLKLSNYSINVVQLMICCCKQLKSLLIVTPRYLAFSVDFSSEM